ncbi:MAG: T9SS type A sorting domain-containing protein [Bacteroidota bacterium]
MKKLFYQLFLAIAFLCITIQNTKAGSVIGADITYVNKGNDSLLVTLHLYRDCNSIVTSIPPISVTSACKTTYFPLTLVSTTDITGVGLNCSVQSRCTGSYPYGIEDRVYTTTVYIGGDTCCFYRLGWKECCRNSAITTGAAGHYFYTEATINKCLAPTNSSPTFASVPQVLLPVGQNQSLNFKTNDPNFDMLSYELITPYSGQDTVINYSGSWSSSKPITFLGFPNPSLTLPAGFYFNNATGFIEFRPTKQNEISVISVKVSEWRMINGVKTFIGSVIRDLQTIVISSANNKQPFFTTTSDEIKMCGGLTTQCFNITADDYNTDDTLSFTFSHLLDSVVITNVGTAKRPIMRVCVTFNTAELNSNKPFEILAKVYDNVCPLRGTGTKLYRLRTGPYMPDSFAINKTLNCRSLATNFVNNSSSSSSFSTLFEIKSANHTYTEPLANTFVVGDVKEWGWHNIKMEISSNAFCDTRTYYDSVFIPQSNFMSVKVGKDSSVCFNSSYTVSPLITNGNAPFKYQWNTGDSTAAISKSLALGTNIFRLELTDAAGCSANDTVLVKYFNPSAVLSGDTVKCINDSITLTATLSNTTKPVYQWAGFATGDAIISTKLTASKQFVFTLVDSSGCFLTQTYNVLASAPALTLTHNHLQCVGDSIRLSATTTGGVGTPTVNWPIFSKTGNNIVLNPSQSAGKIFFYANVTDALGCQSTQNDSVVINNLPPISLTAPANRCENTGLVSLTSLATPTGGVWSGATITGSDFNTNTSGAGNFALKYSYTDPSTGCTAEKNTQITVDATPIADFIPSTTTGNKPLLVGLFNTTADTNATWNWIVKDSTGVVVHTSTQRHTNYTFTTEGKYTVILVATKGSCSDTVEKTNVVVVTTNVGIGRVNAAAVKIYPNPANSFIVVETDVDITEITITDMLGKTWDAPTTIDGKKATLNTEGLSTATYVLKITTADGKQGVAQIAVLR